MIRISHQKQNSFEFHETFGKWIHVNSFGDESKAQLLQIFQTSGKNVFVQQMRVEFFHPFLMGKLEYNIFFDIVDLYLLFYELKNWWIMQKCASQVIWWKDDAIHTAKCNEATKCCSPHLNWRNQSVALCCFCELWTWDSIWLLEYFQWIHQFDFLF